jgi:hypothetical protein
LLDRADFEDVKIGGFASSPTSWVKEVTMLALQSFLEILFYLVSLDETL